MDSTKLSEALSCNTHPSAPHGFNRDSSYSRGRYVCDCEGWIPYADEDCFAAIVDDNKE